MNYIFNESGDIKVRTEKGVEKYLPKHLVEDKFLMRGQHLEIVPAPKSFKINLEEPVSEIQEEKEIVAEVAPAKRGPKSKTK